MVERREGFYFELLDLLKQDPQNRFYADNGRDLLRNKVYESAMKMDKDLIKLLLNNDKIKEKFFTDIDGMLVFDKTAFGWAINNKAFLQDSYTRFKNTIGLIDSNEQFISSKNDVVLSFPYKDCVLEGGQTKEDQKREEIYYNELLAPDDVDRLLAHKVFTNAKRYTKDSEENVTSFNDNDNLLIKGNNLLALSSILKRYENKVKCIYIDPPYNTGNDGFNYNDNFNHSTWLAFMSNRLKLAKKLLREDGTIFISIDNKEFSYLQILMDEIFGIENKKNVITFKRSSVSGAKVINPGVVNVSEFIIVYSKNTNAWKPNRIFRQKERDSRYNTFIENRDSNYENWQYCSVLEAFSKSINIPKSKLKKELGNEYEILLEEFYYRNARNIIRFAALDDKSIGKAVLDIKYISKQDAEKTYLVERENNKPYYLYKGEAILFFEDRLIEVEGKKVFGELIHDIWDDVLPNDLHNEGGVSLKKGKKPEKLLQRIMDLSTNPKDIVVDFHLGSGTTCAVAHKMNRQYIGIEQLYYGENDSLVRLQNVLNGEQGGISKAVNWQGGGSFVYCELKELNQKYINEIQQADDNKLNELYKDISKSEFISYKVDINKLESSEQEFKDLSIDDKKKLLIEILDKNMLYVNYSDIDDEDYSITEEEKAFTKSFYGEE